MSNYLAIATVTAVLRYILGGISRQGGLANVRITTTLPNLIGTNPIDGLNIFLYQVTPNTGYNNIDLPTRNADGFLIQRPGLGMNLQYILTAFTTDNDEIHAQQILASAIRILHEIPVLTRDIINDTIQAILAVDPGNILALNTDLANQVELVKIAPEPLSAEEITKLWSSFFQTQYRTSLSYQASVVVLDSPELIPRSTLPVREQKIHIFQLRRPIIHRIEPQVVEQHPAARIAILGRNLSSQNTIIDFGEGLTQVPLDITDIQIITSIPNDLAAGIRPIRVIHLVGLEPTITDKRRIFQSNTLAFLYAPRITSIRSTNPAGPTIIRRGIDTLEIEFEPALAERQMVDLVIGDMAFSINPDFSIPEAFIDGKGNIRVKKLTNIRSDDFPTGTSLLRLRVDGSDSFLIRDTNPASSTYNQFIGPTVAVI